MNFACVIDNSILPSSYICDPECPDGEIGRRTVFRSQRPQGCAGSNPVLGTSKKPARCAGFFYLDAWKACLPKQTNKRDLRAKRAEDFCLGKPLVGVSGSMKVIQSRALVILQNNNGR